MAHDGRKPRVLYVGPASPPIGGMSTYTEGYLRSRVREACDVRFVRADLVGKYRFGGLARRLLNAVNAAALGVAVLAAIARRRPGIVHIATSSFGGFYEKALLALLARLAGRRTVLHVHGGAFGDFHDRSSPPARRLIRRLLAGNHRVVAISPPLRDTLVRIGVAPERIAVLENAVFLPPAGHGNVGAGRPERQRPVVLFLNRIEPEKGVFDLWAAAERILARRGDVPFRVVGPESGASRALREKASAAGLQERFELPGPATGEARDAAYRSADIYVLPSRLEGMPYGLLEAMSYGLACVVTPVGSVPDIVVHGENGLLVPANDVPALEAAIERLLDDEDLRRRLGAAARRTIEDRFDWDRRAAEIIALYETILAD